MTAFFGAPLRNVLLLLVAVQLPAVAEVDTKNSNAPKAEATNSQVFEGDVLPLSDVVKSQSARADEDALNVSRVLKTKDGKIFTLVKDAVSRKFFLDDELLRRPMRISAVQIPGTQMLVVVNAQSVIDGKLHDIDYWCEQCQLAASQPGNCKCCGNPVELRELPVKSQPSIPSPNAN